MINFHLGIDLHSLMSLGQQLAEIEDVGRKGHLLSNFIKSYQVNSRNKFNLLLIFSLI